MLLFVCLLGHCCLFVGPSGAVTPRSERTGSGVEQRRRGKEGEAWVLDISRHGYRRHRCGACYSLSTFTHVDNVYSVISSIYSRAVESIVCLYLLNRSPASSCFVSSTRNHPSSSCSINLAHRYTPQVFSPAFPDRLVFLAIQNAQSKHLCPSSLECTGSKSDSLPRQDRESR